MNFHMLNCHKYVSMRLQIFHCLNPLSFNYLLNLKYVNSQYTVQTKYINNIVRKYLLTSKYSGSSQIQSLGNLIYLFVL